MLTVYAHDSHVFTCVPRLRTFSARLKTFRMCLHYVNPFTNLSMWVNGTYHEEITAIIAG